jgi:hypothetical protein
VWVTRGRGWVHDQKIPAHCDDDYG